MRADEICARQQGEQEQSCQAKPPETSGHCHWRRLYFLWSGVSQATGVGRMQGALQIDVHLNRRLVTPRRILVESLENDVLDIWRDSRDDAAGHRRLIIQNRVDQQCRIGRRERALARGHFIQDGARGPQIGSGIGRLALQLFRRHVWERAGEFGRVAQGQRLGQIADLRSELSETEVENLQPAIGRDAQVARLQVAMHDAVLVRGCQALGQLDAKLHNFFLRQRSAGKFCVQRGSGDVLGDQKIQIAFAAELVDGGDAGEIHARQRDRFFAKSLARRRVGKQARGQYLERHVALQLLVAGAIDDPHPSGADLLENAVARDGFADHAGAIVLSRSCCRCAWPVMPGRSCQACGSQRILRGGGGKVNERGSEARNGPQRIVVASALSLCWGRRKTTNQPELHQELSSSSARDRYRIGEIAGGYPLDLTAHVRP